MDTHEKKVAYLVSGDSLTVRCRGKAGHLFRGDKKFDKAIQLIRDDDMDELARLTIPEIDMVDYSQLELTLVDGKLLRYGEEVPPRLAKIVLELKNDGLPFQHLLNFWDRLFQNPEQSSVDQLYRFLEDHKVPITSDGMIMAYKSVCQQEDGSLVAYHDRSFSYAIGEEATMDRSQVECSPEHGCGRGLHVGSFEYANDMYSGDQNRVLLEILVDPADVVSVPNDCNCSKVRCCRLLPINICQGEAESRIYEPPKPEPMIDEEAPDSTDTPELQSQETKPVKIGRYFYQRSPIMQDELVDWTEQDFKKLTKSDFPLFFKRLGVEEVYRHRAGKHSDYIAGNHGVYLQYTKADKPVAEKRDNKGPKPVAEDRGTKIGRYFYDETYADAGDVQALTEVDKDPYVQLTPSEFPLFFKRLGATEVYRQRNDRYSNYIACGEVGSYVLYTKKD